MFDHQDLDNVASAEELANRGGYVGANFNITPFVMLAMPRAVTGFALEVQAKVAETKVQYALAGKVWPTELDRITGACTSLVVQVANVLAQYENDEPF